MGVIFIEKIMQTFISSFQLKKEEKLKLNLFGDRNFFIELVKSIPKVTINGK